VAVAGSFAKLQSLIGASTRQQIHNWTTRGVPLKYCRPIEEATGVKREELRPDFRW